jgi:hypothetical protein
LLDQISARVAYRDPCRVPRRLLKSVALRLANRNTAFAIDDSGEVSGLGRTQFANLRKVIKLQGRENGTFVLSTRLLSAALVVQLLSACAPAADSVSIHRFSVVAENQFPPLDQTVNDPATASRLYEEVRALRPQEGTVFCALDFGVRHELSFFMRGQRVLHGVMELGCGVIDFGAGDVRALDEHFVPDLLGALGLYTRGNELWPTPIPRP